MMKNVGSTDRILRVLIALGIVFMYAFGVVSSGVAIVLGVVVLALLATSIMSTCPAYLPFGISTIRKKPIGKSAS